MENGAVAKMVRKLLASPRGLTIVALAVGGIGLIISLCSRDFTWFARFGSLVTFCGIVVMMRPSIVRQDLLVPVVMDETGLRSNDPEYYRRRGEPVPDRVKEDQVSRRAVAAFGPYLTLAGTVIWGFGDLLNLAFGFSH